MTLVFDLYTLSIGEVQYEIRSRGESLNGSETLDQLRAILKNIKEKEPIKLTLSQIPDLDLEIDITEQGLKSLIELRQNLKADSTYTRKIETKFLHYKKRIENIPPGGTEKQKQKLSEISNRLNELFKEYKTYREYRDSKPPGTNPTTGTPGTNPTPTPITTTITNINTRILNASPSTSNTQTVNTQHSPDTIMSTSTSTSQIGNVVNQDTTIKPKTPMLKPTTFSGNFGENINDFLEKYKLACEVNGWVGNYRKKFLPCYLEDVAADWYSYNVRDHHSWENVVTLITQAFQENVEKRILMIKLKNRKFKTDDEPSMKYIQDILTLCAKIDPNMPSDRTKEFLLDGLPQDMLKSVMLRGDDTLVQVIDNIKKISGVNRMVDIRSAESELNQCNFIAHSKQTRQNKDKQDEILEKLNNLELKWAQKTPSRYREGGHKTGKRHSGSYKRGRRATRCSKSACYSLVGTKPSGLTTIKIYEGNNTHRAIVDSDNEIPAGNAKVEPARILLEDDIPVARPPYRTAHKERELIESHVDKMIAAGVIRESQSAYSAPVVLVKKNNKDPRFCVDYRQLNKKVTDYKFPMPRTDDFLNHLNGAKFFTSLDLKNCFWQIPLAEEDKYKTAFATCTNLHEYNVLPFGLKSSPSICQKAMYDAVKGLLWNTVLVYMDDWLIPSSTWENHLISLRKVFERLRKVNLKVKPEKCSFGYDNTTVLGHRVSSKGIAPDEEKLRSVKLFPRPKTVKQVRSWLGLSNYYRMFIPQYAQSTRNLQDLTKKNAKFQWKPEHEAEFQLIKKKLLTAPVLCHFDPELETELVIDASDEGVGAILQQKGPKDKAGKVVAYASRNLKGAERKYFTTEKEMLALIFGTTIYRNYLWGIKFTVITDHASLRYWNNIKNPSSRLMRFVLRLSEFDFEVIHKAGKLNTAADALSRTPIDSPAYNVEDEDIPCFNVRLENLDELQLQDSELAQIIKAFDDPNAKRNIRRKTRRYILENGILYKKVYHNGQDYKVTVIPRSLRPEILNSIHDSPLTGAHLGRDKCMLKLKT
ncbi:hypothetical protein WDU94_003597, partial [Cyamophila willieti]